MDTLTRHHMLVMAGVEVRSAFDDDPYELDEVSAALVDALSRFDDEERRAKPLRIPKGFEGGGRFRRVSDAIFKVLADWANGEGPDNPFDSPDLKGVLHGDPAKRREQLRQAAKARGLTLRRGATENEIANALLDDVRKGKAGKGDGQHDADVPDEKPKAKPAVKKAAPKKKAPAKKAAEPKPASPLADEAQSIMANATDSYEIDALLGGRSKKQLVGIASHLGISTDRRTAAQLRQDISAHLMPESGREPGGGRFDVIRLNDVLTDMSEPAVDLDPHHVEGARAGWTDVLAATPGRSSSAPESSREALSDYKSDAHFREVNDALANGESHPIAEAVRAAMAPTDEDIVVFRGGHGLGRRLPGRGRGKIEGAEWTRNDFASTSASEDVARDFGVNDASDDPGAQPYVMRIGVRAGTRAVAIDSVLEREGPDDIARYLEEQEVVLDGGLTYRIARDYGVVRGVRRLDVDVVPAGAKPERGGDISATADYAAIRRAKGSGDADWQLAAIQEQQGFDAPPRTVSAADLDAAVAAGEVTETFRGLNGPDAKRLAEQFRSGDLYPGSSGAYGHGTYVAMDESAARLSAGRWEPDDNTSGAVLRIGIRSDARVATIEQIRAEQRRYLAGLDPSSPEYEVNSDAGRFAALRGYDAIRVKTGQGGDQMVILNRGAVIVQADLDPEAAGRAEQARIDAARPYADVAGQLDEIIANESSPAALLARLDAAGQRHGIADELAPVRAAVEEAQRVEVENRIRAAYRTVHDRRGGDWISLAEIRDELGESTNRHDIDDALRRIEQQDGANIVPESNQKTLTQADRDSAVVIGDQKKHFLHLDDPSDRPVPSPRAEMDRLLAAHGITRDGEAGQAARFDPKTHQSITGRGDLRAGQPVEVVRPGFTLSRDGQQVRLSKATVEAADEPAGPTDSLDLPDELVDSDVEDGEIIVDRDSLVRVESAKTVAELRQIARDRQIKIPSRVKLKADIRDYLRQELRLRPGEDVADYFARTGGRPVDAPTAPELAEQQAAEALDELARPSGLPTGRKLESGDFDDLAERIAGRTERQILEVLQDLNASELARLARKFPGGRGGGGLGGSQNKARGIVIPDGLTLDERRRWLAAKLAERPQWRSDDMDAETRSRVLALAEVRYADHLRAAGHDVTPGHDELHHYWTRGEGRAKWVHSPKPWTTLVALLSRHVGPEKAKVFASRWFIEVFHYAAGSDKNRVAHGHPPRGHRVGPG